LKSSIRLTSEVSQLTAKSEVASAAELQQQKMEWHGTGTGLQTVSKKLELLSHDA